jgi:hypothetical protein
MPTSIILNPRNPRDRGLQDVCRRLSSILDGKPAELLALEAGFWLLIVFFDSGVVEHPLGASGGQEHGKALTPWYDREHEVLGFGRNIDECTAGILRRGKSVRLKGIRRADAETHKMRLLFQHLDTKQVFFPDQLFLHYS